MKKLVLVCVMPLLVLGAFANSAWAQAKTRSYAGGSYLLEINGQSTFLRKVDGGDISAVVVQNGAKKQIGAPVYGEFEMQMGPPADKGLQDWIKSTLAGSQKRTSGKVIAADINHDAKSVREFREALITEVTFPAADAASKEAAFLTVKFAPQDIKESKPSGTVAKETEAKQKAMLSSNFRLTVDGLDCAHVSKVDAVTFKQAAVPDATGIRRDPTKGAGAMTLSNLKVTLSGPSGQSWADWHKSFVIEGKHGDDQEKSGTLEFLDPTLKKPLLTIKFQHLGIFSLSDEPSESGSDKIQKTVAELYFEGMTVEFPG